MTTKEHPILFSGEMVRAILDGRKTQARRPVKRFGRYSYMDGSYDDRFPTVIGNSGCCELPEWAMDDIVRRSPFGVLGDRLWVRETHRFWDNGQPSQTSTWEASVRYQADNAVQNITAMLEDCPDDIATHEATRWHPNIHMARWVSRITLEVKRVWVERVQDISEEDARAEGIKQQTSIGPCRAMGWKDYSGGPGKMQAVDSFRTLWDSTYGAKGLGWTDNSWVWACEFNRAEIEVT